jgi:hypothetical protein
MPIVTIPTGTSLYGRVDNIPGVGYVATEFSHVGFFPLWPQRSFLVLHTPGVGSFLDAQTAWVGLEIPTPLWKSALAAWGRSAAFVYLLARLLGAFLRYSGGEMVNWGPVYWAAGIWAVLLATAWLSRMHPGLAAVVLRRADAPPEVVEKVERVLGRMPGAAAGQAR